MYYIGGPNGVVSFYIDANGFVVGVVRYDTRIDTSPVVITPAQPIGPISSIDLGTLYQELLAISQGN